MKLLQLALVLTGALLVFSAAVVAPGLSREGGMALCAAATLWAAMLGGGALALNAIQDQEDSDPDASDRA